MGGEIFIKILFAIHLLFVHIFIKEMNSLYMNENSSYVSFYYIVVKIIGRYLLLKQINVKQIILMKSVYLIDNNFSISNHFKTIY